MKLNFTLNITAESKSNTLIDSQDYRDDIIYDVGEISETLADLFNVVKVDSVSCIVEDENGNRLETDIDLRSVNNRVAEIHRKIDSHE